MYETENLYSLNAFREWRRGTRSLKVHRQSSTEIAGGDFWRVDGWEQLREAVSFLALMNKRHVLYFRGQKEPHEKCLAAVFRPSWRLEGQGDTIPLAPGNRARYLEVLRDSLRPLVYDAVRSIGTPREYIIDILPAATAAVLQHYELWPTPFLDLTRTLSIAASFATLDATRSGYIYVFAMPDLRGSITTDLDQHLTLARLEAVCPPAAKRPHQQDAYLVARAPEPHNLRDERLWDDWASKSNLMRRLVAKFELPGEPLIGGPGYPRDYLLPPHAADRFREVLRASLFPAILHHLEVLTREV